MCDLVEHILNKDYLSANELFEERMIKLQEKKLYESKRMIASEMNEAAGGLTAKEIADRRARGFVKASEVLRDPRDIEITLNKNVRKIKKKKVVKEAAPEVQPDPEGKVRGGQTRPVKGTFRRKAAAAVLKTARKVGSAAGEAAVRINRAKEVWNQYQQQKQSQTQSPFPTDMHQTQQAAEPTRTQKAAKDAGKWASGKYGAMAKTFFEDSEN